MSEWKKVKIKDIASLDNGINFSKSAYAPGVKIIGVSDFKDRFFPDFSTLQEVKEKIVKRGDYLQFGDILFVRSNGNRDLVGRCMLIDKNIKSTFSGFCIRLRIIDLNSYNPYFFTYHFKTSLFRKSIAGSAIGANIQNLSQNRLGNYELKIPEYFTQCRIAEILSRYDALIENYQKQIKLLEESAQRLYKEWFVDLRFPGHENTKIVDGVPEGWERKNITELADIQYGYAFDGKLFNSDKVGVPIARIRNIPDGYTNDYTTEEASNEYIVKNGDILAGMDGIFHINTWSGSDAYLVQRTCLFRPKDEILKGFIFQAIKGPIKVFEQTLVGATVAHLGKKHIDSIDLIMPKDIHLYRPFNDLFFYRQELLNQIRFLAEARDRLLPKLMSGDFL